MHKIIVTSLNYSPRILGRRYPLNKSHSTWLDVGVNVAPESNVQVVIVNKRNEELVITEGAWAELCEAEEIILRHLSGGHRLDPTCIVMEDLTYVFTTFLRFRYPGAGEACLQD